MHVTTRVLRFGWLSIAFLVQLAFGSNARAQVVQVEREALAVGDSVGAGAWKAQGKIENPSQRWSVDVKRTADGSVSGQITVEDSPLLSSGTLVGKVEGQSIAGTINDDNGLQAATFSGRRSDSGTFRGTYEDRTGEVGTWEWDAQLSE